MRILVTGGAGFIGSNLVHALLSGGNDVAVIDNLSTGSAANLDPRATFRRLDILDDEFDSAVAEFGPEAIVHLAAQASVAVSVRDPEFDRVVNAEGTRRVAAAARAVGARKVISASSAAVYGEPAELPLRESSPTNRTGPPNSKPSRCSRASSAEAMSTSPASASATYTVLAKTLRGRVASSRSSATASTRLFRP